ncbi:phage holin family protein [Calditerricola satsumensis]|uniref:Membrane protein n=1 Tax=Calditerricola satsumensis TaxID=373054 RepID=A0A8J3B692_9BACI|nr:phage holin family protein [Calditerricola satsumensis]GGJ91152.1 membrane protein [Calditerricola satsumensis]
MRWLGLVVRFIVSALVLLFVGYIVPGFSVFGFGNAIMAALAIAVIGWVIERFFGDNISPYSRGIVGFLVSAIVIYATQYLVPGVRVTILGALLAALVIGIIDLFIPTPFRFSRSARQNGNGANK